MCNTSYTSDCYNYKGITKSCIGTKMFAQIMNKRLRGRKSNENIYEVTEQQNDANHDFLIKHNSVI